MVDAATLGERVRGEVLTLGDDAYEDARRVHNAIHDRHPEVGVTCLSTPMIPPRLSDAAISVAWIGDRADRGPALPSPTNLRSWTTERLR